MHALDVMEEAFIDLLKARGRKVRVWRVYGTRELTGSWQSRNGKTYAFCRPYKFGGQTLGVYRACEPQDNWANDSADVRD